MGTLIVFSSVAGMAQKTGRRPYCNCFGSIARDRLGWSTIRRNLLLALPGLALEVGQVEGLRANVVKRSLAIRLRSRQLDINLLRMLLGGVQFAYLVIVARNQQRLMTVVSRTMQTPQSGTLTNRMSGTVVEDFALTDLRGTSVTRSDVLAHHRPVGMVFIDPTGCERCIELVNPIAELGRELEGKAILVIVTTRGSEFGVESYAAVAPNHANVYVLFQNGYEYFEKIGISKVPSACVLNRNGVVLTEFAVGHEAVLQLLQDGLAT